MADWRQIQARIRKAKTGTDAAAKLAELYERTRDAMVAFELAQFQEKAGEHAEAARWYTAAQALFERYEFLLLPSAQVFPFDAGTQWPRAINGVVMDTYHRWMEVVVPASLLGGPVLNVPVGFGPQDLPMGLQIIGRRQADLAVLQLGHAYDLATRWVSQRLPALLA